MPPMLARTALALTLTLACAASAAAQPAARDFSGTWSNASLTWLERPANLKGRTLTEDEAKKLAAEAA